MIFFLNIMNYIYKYWFLMNWCEYKSFTGVYEAHQRLVAYITDDL